MYKQKNIYLNNKKLSFIILIYLLMITNLGSVWAENSKFKLGVAEGYSDFAPSNVGIIGLKYLHKIGETSTVIDVYPNTPAERAGILVGDRILEVDGSNILPLTADQVFSIIAGKPETTVELKLMRCNQNYGTHLGCHSFFVNLKRLDMNQIASDKVFRVYKYGN